MDSSTPSQTAAPDQASTSSPSSSLEPRRPKTRYQCRATQLEPAWDRLLPGEPVAIDIEFQQYKIAGQVKQRHRVGRVGIVNTIGEAVLDVYAAYPKEDGVKKIMPPARFGVIWQDLTFENHAKPAQKVEKWVKEILKDRRVIMHDGRQDRTAFMLETDVFAHSTIFDTQSMFSYVQHNGRPALWLVADEVLNETIQEGIHSPVEDAHTAMKLYLIDHPYDRQAESARNGGVHQQANETENENGSRRRRRRRSPRAAEHQRAPTNQDTSTPISVPDIADNQEFPPLGQTGQEPSTTETTFVNW